jgi:hypothetical protein
MVAIVLTANFCPVDLHAGDPSLWHMGQSWEISGTRKFARCGLLAGTGIIDTPSWMPGG